VVPQSISDGKVSIKDKDGNVVKTIELGSQKAGTADFIWDGTNEKGEVAPAPTPSRLRPRSTARPRRCPPCCRQGQQCQLPERRRDDAQPGRHRQIGSPKSQASVSKPQNRHKERIMSFNIGLSGLYAANKALNVTGNNIANVATTGFKSSRAEFADQYSQSIRGTSGGKTRSAAA
jgi:hypothetical protein